MKPPAQARGHVGGRERALEGRLNGGALRAARRGENDQRISGQRMSGQRVSGQRVSGSIAPPGLQDAWMDIRGLASVATFTRPSPGLGQSCRRTYSSRFPRENGGAWVPSAFFFPCGPKIPAIFLIRDRARPRTRWDFVGPSENMLRREWRWGAA